MRQFASSASRALIALLAIAGTWQLGAGAYIHAKAWLAQRLIASAWDRTLMGDRDVRPWPWADTWPLARLRIADANVDLYVLADASGRSLAFGPGYMSGSAPLGSDAVSMIAGHRDTHFAFMRSLPVGAEVSLQTSDGATHRYRIVESHVFDSRQERLATSGEALILLTCYPFDALVPGGPLRYAAIAIPPSRAR
jgi:sortase A